MAVKRFPNWASLILAIFTLAGIVYLCSSFFSFLPAIVEKANPNIVVPVVAGMFSLAGYFITRYLERKKIIEQQIREQKIPVYEEFVAFVFKIIGSVKNSEKIDEKEMEAFMMKFNQKSIIWLSDDSLKAFIKWRLYAIQAAASNAENDVQKSLFGMLELEEMFYQFRKDIGHENKGLKRGDLLSMFINDLDKYNLH